MVKVRKNVDEMHGYVPGEQPRGEGWIKLNTNENVECSPAALAALRSIDADDLRLYPDAQANELRAQLARRHSVELDQVMIGNGSDDILTLLFRAICDPGDTVVFTMPSYSLYPVLSQIQGAKSIEIRLGPDFELPVRRLSSIRAAIVFITNPNNPAGTWYPPDQIADICESGQNLVVVDEAYADYSGADCVELVSRYANICIVRSLSKAYGLAGVRIGYSLSSGELSAALRKVKDSYNVGRPSQIAALAALTDEDWAQESWRRTAERRDWLADRLTLDLRLKVHPSRANFILVDLGDYSAADAMTFLRERKILVRHFADDPLVDNCLRITVGTQAELEVLVEALGSALENQKPATAK